MTTIVKENSPLVVPAWIRRRAGLAEGDRVEFKAVRGVITIVTKPSLGDDDDSPEDRRRITARLDEAERGPFVGPFRNGREVADYLKKRRKKST